VSQPAEWGARFQELTGEAGHMATRSLRRYQELLERVARRELSPEDVQRQFQAYLQDQATSSTRELVELSVGLLAGLLYAEAKYREALLDGLLPPEAPLPPPPAPTGADVMEWFQALSTYATQQSSQAIARHQRLVDAVAKGEIPPAQMQEQGRRFLETHAPDLLNEVMQLGLGFVGRLQQSSATLTDGLYDRVLGKEAQAAAVPDPPVYMDLTGPAGSIAEASLVIENTRAEPAAVTCRVSEFAARAFGRRFRAPIEISPAQVTLDAGEQREITLRLPLDAAMFAPGADYVATLQITGAGEHDFVVHLLVRCDELSTDHSAAEPTAPAVAGGGIDAGTAAPIETANGTPVGAATPRRRTRGRSASTPAAARTPASPTSSTAARSAPRGTTSRTRPATPTKGKTRTASKRR
jgi:hypothetical protein